MGVKIGAVILFSLALALVSAECRTPMHSTASLNGGLPLLKVSLYNLTSLWRNGKVSKNTSVGRNIASAGNFYLNRMPSL